MGNRLTGRNKSKSLTPNQENASRKVIVPPFASTVQSSTVVDVKKCRDEE